MPKLVNKITGASYFVTDKELEALRLRRKNLEQIFEVHQAHRPDVLVNAEQQQKQTTKPKKTKKSLRSSSKQN